MIRRPPRSTLFPTRRSSDLASATSENPVDVGTGPGSTAQTVAAYRRRSARWPKTCAGTDRSKATTPGRARRSEEHTSELQSRQYLVCRLLLEKKQNIKDRQT